MSSMNILTHFNPHSINIRNMWQDFTKLRMSSHSLAIESNGNVWKNFTKLRMSSHNLIIETGRNVSHNFTPPLPPSRMCEHFLSAAHLRMCKRFLLPTSIVRSCHSIDTHIRGRKTQKVPPLKFSKIFHVISISTHPTNRNCWQFHIVYFYFFSAN